jgi:peptide deformylase
VSSSHSRFTHDESQDDDFGDALRRARREAGFSQHQLAEELGFERSYISKLETGASPPTRGLAERADEILQQKGALVILWRAYAAGRETGKRPRARELDYGVRSEPHAHRAGLVVVHEESRLVLDRGRYTTRVRRTLYNGSDAPITRYLIRVAVDRHPNLSPLSNALYRRRPLELKELDLRATCAGEAMGHEIEHDRDAFKEIWLLFANDDTRFPLYPGDTTTIEYHYAVGADKWGKWWQRAIRVPTERLSVELGFPATVEPMLWGLETSLTAERLPVQPTVGRQELDGLVTYRWSTRQPTLHSRFRFEWRFRNDISEPEPLDLGPSGQMRQLGIVQRGDAILTRACAPFDLPREADIASATGKLLITYLEPLAMLHEFGKGMGLAAPQIGVQRAAAVVRLPRRRPEVLFNPKIISASKRADQRLEGCLSFFDVRGPVRRSLAIQVEHTDLHGTRRISKFDDAAARHWQHEIDHLGGNLYIDRMDDPATELVPVEEYDHVGEEWSY